MKKILLFAAPFLFTGCSSIFPKQSHKEKELTTTEVEEKFKDQHLKEKELDIVYKKLLKISKDSEEAFRIYMETKNAEARSLLTDDEIRQANFNAAIIPKGLEREINFNKWDGPFETPLKILAQLTDYSITFVGVPPVIEPPIHLKGERRKIIEIIRDISYQVDPIADISIMGDSKKIIVKYKRGG